MEIELIKVELPICYSTENHFPVKAVNGTAVFREVL